MGLDHRLHLTLLKPIQLSVLSTDNYFSSEDASAKKVLQVTLLPNQTSSLDTPPLGDIKELDEFAPHDYQLVIFVCEGQVKRLGAAPFTTGHKFTALPFINCNTMVNIHTHTGQKFTVVTEC